MYKEIEGDLIKLAQEGSFDVIAHGVNCFCRQKSGLAPQMVKAFATDNFPLENTSFYGDINKLGNIDYRTVKGPLWTTNKIPFDIDAKPLTIVNAYTQYKIKKFNDQDYEYTTTENPFDYDAFRLCMKKMNQIFVGKKIGLPKIGSGLAGGDEDQIQQIIMKELKDCDVTVVIFKP